jgi:SAM-dependent methyltransferase
MTISVPLQRWYLGLHGLGLLREWPFGDADTAAARMGAMRRILDGEGDPEIFEERVIDELDVADAYREWSATYDEPNPLISAEEGALWALLAERPVGRAIDVASGTGRIAEELRRLGHDVVAMDRSEAMLSVARSRSEPVPTVAADLDSTSDIHPIAVATGGHAFFKRADGTRAVTRNHAHWPSAHISAATSAGFVVRRCAEVFVDDALLHEFGVDDLQLAPEAAIKGLPLALLWSFERAG